MNVAVNNGAWEVAAKEVWESQLPDTSPQRTKRLQVMFESDAFPYNIPVEKV